MRENRAAIIHPPLFRRGTAVAPNSFVCRLSPVFVQIVFAGRGAILLILLGLLEYIKYSAGHQ
jgi:hypothetical protein